MSISGFEEVATQQSKRKGILTIAGGTDGRALTTSGFPLNLPSRTQTNPMRRNQHIPSLAGPRLFLRTLLLVASLVSQLLASAALKTEIAASSASSSNSLAVQPVSNLTGTLTVAADGSAGFKTVQSAIAAAATGP